MTSGQQTILVIDDDASIRRLTLRLLHRLDYLTLEAANGNQGLTHISEDSEKIGGVLLDLNLPDGDGTEWAEKFRSLRPNLPIVYFTGSHPPNQANTNREDRNFFLKKPFTSDSIREVFQKVFASDA